MVFRCCSQGIHTKAVTKWFVERAFLNMKCPAIFKGSGAHHSMTYHPKWSVARLDICQQATLLFIPFCKSHWEAKLFKWVVSVFLHVRMIVFWVFSFQAFTLSEFMASLPCAAVLVTTDTLCWPQVCTHYHMFPMHTDSSAACSHLPVRSVTGRASRMWEFTLSSQI